MGYSLKKSLVNNWQAFAMFGVVGAVSMAVAYTVPIQQIMDSSRSMQKLQEERHLCLPELVRPYDANRDSFLDSVEAQKLFENYNLTPRTLTNRVN